MSSRPKILRWKCNIISPQLKLSCWFNALNWDGTHHAFLGTCVTCKNCFRNKMFGIIEASRTLADDWLHKLHLYLYAGIKCNNI